MQPPLKTPAAAVVVVLKLASNGLHFCAKSELLVGQVADLDVLSCQCFYLVRTAQYTL